MITDILIYIAVKKEYIKIRKLYEGPDDVTK